MEKLINKQTSDSNREQSVVPLLTSPPSHTLNEPYLKQEDFQNVIEYASTLQLLDIQKDLRRKQGIEALVLTNFEQGIPRSVVSQVIEDHMDIGKKYALQALDHLHPLPEQLQADLEKYKASPSPELIDRKYCYEIKKALEQYFPQKKVEIEMVNGFPNHAHFFLISQTQIEKIRGFFKKRLVKKIIETREKLASIKTNHYSIGFEIDVYSPLFLRACGETLKKLESWIPKYFKFVEKKYHFDPENREI